MDHQEALPPHPRSPASELQEICLESAIFSVEDDGRDAVAPTSLGSVPPDCGPVPGTLLFSSQKAKMVREQQHPRDRVEVGPGQFECRPYPLDAPLGSHIDQEDLTWLWRRLTCKEAEGPSESSCCQLLCSGAKPPVKQPPAALLAKHGLAVVLYFKFLKFMAVLLAGMAVLALPPLIFYTQGSAYAPATRTAMMKQDGLAGLFFTTMGSLGEGTTICQQADEGSTLSLVCPAGVISSVSTFYGQPRGACHCPAAQKPRPETLACPTDQCGSSGGSGVSSGCYPHLGLTEAGEYCCAARLGSKHQPDLSAVNVGPNYGCNSGTALGIVRGVCVGQANCTLAVQGAHTFSWAAVGGEAAADCTGGGLCQSTFLTRGNFSQCGASSRSLIIQAHCKPSNIQVGASPWSSLYGREDVVTAMACLDALAVVLFLLGLHYLGRKELRDRDAINGQVCTAADYTVKVTGLPKASSGTALAKDLKAHFERVLSEAKPVRQPGLLIRVADVNIATSEYELIRAKKDRGAAARRLDRAAGELRLLQRFRPQATAALRSKELQTQAARLAFEAAAEEVDELAASKGSGGVVEPVAAFVTFEQEEGVARALRAYRDLGVLRGLLMPERLRFLDSTIKVERAAEPASILWENLLPARERPWVVLRRMVTLGACLVVLVVSFGLVWKAQQAQTIVSLKYPQVSCAGYTVDTRSSSSSSSSPYVLTRESVERDVFWDYYQQSQGDTGKLQCFCQGALQQHGLKALNLHFTNPSTGEGERLCLSYARSTGYVTSLLVLASFAIVLVNCVLQGVLRSLTSFERHASKAEEVVSLTTKLFVVSLINTALLSLLTSANLSYFQGSDPQSTAASLRSSSWSFFSGPFGDFSEGWYRAVGVSLLLTMILNVFGPPITTVAALASSRLRRCWDRGCGLNSAITRVATQKDLDSLYVGPAFSLEERYSAALTTLFVTLIFCSGMPLLLPVAALAMGVSLVADKLALFRLCRAPAPLDDKLARLTRELLPYAALLHLGFAAWAVTSPTQFSKSTVSLQAALPLSSHAMNSTAAAIASRGDVVLSVGASSSLWGRVFYDHKALPLVLVGLCLAAVLGWRLAKAVLGGPLSLLERSVPLVALLFEQEYEWQGLAPYLHAIPTDRLEYAVRLATVKPDMAARYQAELERRRREGPGLTRWMEGLETYHYPSNAEYLDSFALDSEAIAQHSRRRGAGGASQTEGGWGAARRGGLWGALRLVRAVARLSRTAMTRPDGKKQKSQVTVSPPTPAGV